MSDDGLPFRPRISDYALARRHVTDGHERVVIVNASLGGSIEMTAAEWGAISFADGTRDFDGICLAAARAGCLERSSALRELLLVLLKQDLLVDGTDDPVPPTDEDPPEPTPRDRPLDLYRDFRLVCDANGFCCGMFPSIEFSTEEAARARALRPDVLDGGNFHERVFMPESGVSPNGTHAVTLVDGSCAYLAPDGKCSLHALAGPSGKPWGCRAFPATYIDDGEAVRISVRCECPCVLASGGRRDGEPIVNPAARTSGDLEPLEPSILPSELRIAPRGRRPRHELVQWSHAVLEGPWKADVVAALWALAKAADEGDLDPARAKDAVANARTPRAAELVPWVAKLAAIAWQESIEDDSWRARRDPSRILVAAIGEATRAIALEAPLGRALATPASAPDVEQFYACAAIHGHHLLADVPLCYSLRDRAIRIFVARSLATHIPEGALPRAVYQYPLAALEVAMRTRGLNVYVQHVVHIPAEDEDE